MFDSSFNRILALEKELYTEYADKNEDERKRWDSRFFNSIENFSFFVNEGYLDDSKMINFFKPAIINWFENIFEKHYAQEDIENPDCFPEMKKLYKRLKNKAQEYKTTSNDWRRMITVRFTWNCLLIAFVIFLLAIGSDFSVKMFYSGGGWGVQILSGLIAIIMITFLLIFASIVVRGFRRVLFKMFEMEDDEPTT